MPAPTFPPLTDAAWPEALADLKGGFATRLNVYRVMAHRPELLRAWADLRDHVVVQTAELSEVAILRTGHHMKSDYEWAHHVVRARALGMSDARIEGLRGPLAAMVPEDAVIARAVDALFGPDRALAPTQVTDVVALVGQAGLFDLIATVGFYTVLGGILNSLDVPLDSDVAAALAQTPGS
jgi:alkylhydroperoxidase family enzyme